MYEDRWADGARVIHLLFSFLAVLLVYWSIWYTSQVKPMSRGRFLFCVSVSLAAGLLVHYTLDTLVGVP